MEKSKLWTKDFVIISFVNFLAALNFYLLMIVISEYAMSKFDSSPSEAGLSADDMALLYEALRTADGIVIGSPIYMNYVTAQTKLFLDRLFAFFKLGVGCTLPRGKRGVLVYSQGAGENGAVLMETLSLFLTTRMGIEVKGIVGGNGLNELGVIKQRHDLLEKAFQLGRELAG